MRVARIVAAPRVAVFFRNACCGLGTFAGPGTNLGHNSILYMLECQFNFIMKLQAQMVDAGVAAAAVKPEVCDAFAASLQRSVNNSAFNWGACEGNTGVVRVLTGSWGLDLTAACRWWGVCRLQSKLVPLQDGRAGQQLERGMHRVLAGHIVPQLAPGLHHSQTPAITVKSLQVTVHIQVVVVVVVVVVA